MRTLFLAVILSATAGAQPVVHQDGVGLDEWVAFEYAKVRQYYDEQGVGDRTTIEFFNGPHQIHAVGTLEFIRKWFGR